MPWKKKEIEQPNTYENKWRDLQYELSDVSHKIRGLFAQIQYSLHALNCFEEGTPDHDAEQQHLAELRQKMLCACGAYDGCAAELRMLYDKHNNEMRNHLCLNGLARTDRDCHKEVRWAAQLFRKYG